MANGGMNGSIERDILRKMLRIRLFEERTIPLVEAGEILCPVHLYIGQEGIAAGVCANLTASDFAVSTHRSHGHYIAKGGSLDALMAELLGKTGGCSHGRGGSMHIVDRAAGFLGSSAIVGGTIPIAVGAALTITTQGSDAISVAFFGDGATDEGVFYESLNFAAVMKLPVAFICENNQFSTHMPDFLRQSNPCISERIAGFKVETRQVDGNDARAVYETAREMIERARSEHRPFLLEARTYRWMAHVGITVDEDIGYRRKSDIDHWKSKCPIKRLRGELEESGVLRPGDYDTMRAEVAGEVERAVEYAHASPCPAAGSLAAAAPEQESFR